MSTIEGLRKRYVSQMGFSVEFREIERGTYGLFVGGRPLLQRNNEPVVYRGLQQGITRFHKEVDQVENFESRLIRDGKWHPVRLCAGGCGLEMRVTPQTYPDGTIVTVEQQLNERRRCVSCGPFPTEGGQ